MSLALWSARASCFCSRKSAASAFAAIFFSQLVFSLAVPVALMRGAGAFQFLPDTWRDHTAWLHAVQTHGCRCPRASIPRSRMRRR